MNDARRQTLRSISDRMDLLVQELLEVRSLEKAAFDSRPVGLQHSATGHVSAVAIDDLGTVADAVSSAAAELRNYVADVGVNAGAF